jgi:PEP-CTERM motif
MKFGVAASMALAGALTIASGLPALSPAQAAVVDLTYNLDLNGMSTGTCPGGVCGTVTVVGDTASTLTYTVDLATGVSFHANHSGSSGTGTFFYFDVTDGGVNPITVLLDGTTSGTIGGKTWSYNPPVRGDIVPGTGNFPGTYNFSDTCTNGTSGKICGSELEFTVGGGTVAFPLVIGAPPGGGLFAGDAIAFVADLSVSGSCGDLTCRAGTGLVGSGPGISIRMSTVPEPSTWAMMLVGFVGLGYAGYRSAGAGQKNRAQSGGLSRRLA